MKRWGRGAVVRFLLEIHPAHQGNERHAKRKDHGVDAAQTGSEARPHTPGKSQSKNSHSNAWFQISNSNVAFPTCKQPSATKILAAIPNAYVVDPVQGHGGGVRDQPPQHRSLGTLLGFCAQAAGLGCRGGSRGGGKGLGRGHGSSGRQASRDMLRVVIRRVPRGCLVAAPRPLILVARAAAEAEAKAWQGSSRERQASCEVVPACSKSEGCSALCLCANAAGLGAGDSGGGRDKGQQAMECVVGRMT